VPHSNRMSLCVDRKRSVEDRSVSFKI
jgi:hypothetical protein